MPNIAQVAAIGVVLVACASGVAFRLGSQRAAKELANARQIYLQEKAARQRAEEMNKKRAVVAGQVNLPFIGMIRTMFPKRFGTPRQGALAQSTMGIVELHKNVLGQGALDGLETYSHAWLLFYFHANSDESKLANRGDEQKTFKGRIKPPGMGGAKAGVLSTRSPHRPSRLGLSLVKIERVEDRRLVVSGVDLLDQTPIFDIKPFVPADVPLTPAVFPAWVADRAKDGQDDDSAPLFVEFVPEATAQLDDVLDVSEYARMFLGRDVDRACEVLAQALRLDVRAVYHGRYETSERTFFATFCDVGLHFVVKELEGGRPKLLVTRCEREVLANET